MMEKIRTAASSIIVKIIFAIIILAFIFTGVGGLFGSNTNSADDERLYIAKVDGEGISRAAFERNVQNASQYMKSLSGENEQFDKLIRNNVFKQIVDDYLSYKLSSELDLSIGNDLIKNAITQQPYFFKDGKFDNELYLSLLTENGYTPDSYAEGIRSNLQRLQLLTGLLQTDFILPVELEIGPLLEQKRTIYTAMIPKDIVSVPEDVFSDDKVRQYYEEHKNAFNSSKELFKLETVRISYPLLESKVKVTDKEVKEYYLQNNNDYVSPTQYSYSAIEFNDSDKANEVYELLRKGEKFSTLAEKFAEYDLQREQKGWLGWFQKDNLPSMLSDAKLSKKGEYSKPIQIDGGNYLIVKLDDINKEKVIPLDTIFAKVKSDLVKKIARINFKNEENYIDNLVKKGLSLEEIEYDLQQKIDPEISLVESSWLDRNTTPLSLPEIQEAIDNLQMIDENGNPNDIIAGPIFSKDFDMYYVFKVKKHRNIGQQSFEESKDDIVSILKNTYIQDQYEVVSNEIVNDLNQNGFDSSKGISFNNKQTISRDSDGIEQTLIDVAYSLVQRNDGKDVYGLAALKDGNAVVTITDVLTPQESTNDISQTLSELLLNSSLDGFFGELRSSSKIEIMPNANL